MGDSLAPLASETTLKDLKVYILMERRKKVKKSTMSLEDGLTRLPDLANSFIRFVYT